MFWTRGLWILYSTLPWISSLLVNEQDAKDFLFQDFLAFKLQVHPLEATEAGYHDYDGLIGPSSLDDFQFIQSRCGAFVAQGQYLVNSNLFNGSALQHLEHLVHEALVCSEGMEHQGYLFAPITEEDGVQNLGRILQGGFQTTPRAQEDFANLLKRLQMIPVYIDDSIAVLREAMAKKMTYPDLVIESLHEQLQGQQVTQVEFSDFFQPFQNQSNPPDPALLRKAMDTIMLEILPTMLMLDNFVQRAYLNKTRSPPGLSGSFNGLNYYYRCLEYFTGLKVFSITEIQKEALKDLQELSDLSNLPNVSDSSDMNELFPQSFFRSVPHEISQPEELRFPTIMSLWTKQEDLPEFMKFVPRGHKERGPSQFPGYSAFQNGWNLYLLSLALDGDPRTEQRRSEIARAVVDIGVHGLKWTEEEAKAFLMDNALSPDEIQNELRKIYQWPGYSVGGIIGRNRILSEKHRYQDAMGDEFDVGLFHQHVIKCIGPVSNLEKCMKLSYNR